MATVYPKHSRAWKVQRYQQAIADPPDGVPQDRWTDLVERCYSEEEEAEYSFGWEQARERADSVWAWFHQEPIPDTD